MVPATQQNMVDRAIVRIAERFGGGYSKEVERFIKFTIVGVIGAIVDFTTLNVLQTTILVPIDPYQGSKIALATGAGFCAAVFSNFIWNRYWTYPDSRAKKWYRQLLMFYSVNTAALFFRLVFVSLTFHFFAHLGEDTLLKLGVIDTISGEEQTQLGTNIAQALAVGVAMFWNFFVNRFLTYNDVSSNQLPPTDDSD
jgi:putative flippase GtrA